MNYMDAVEILSVITTDAAQRFTLTEMDGAIAEAIQALESMPEYERLKERDRAKKPDLEGDGYDPEGNMVYDTWICPNCETKYEVDYDHYDFCPKCGQRIDWSEEENGGNE